MQSPAGAGNFDYVSSGDNNFRSCEAMHFFDESAWLDSLIFPTFETPGISAVIAEAAR